jgi:TonB-dependent starch-binding outer membrane protein SusC
MKNRLLNGLLVFLTVLFAGFAQAQDITGTVSDNSGPLPGASVVVKGTTNSASTDLNGKYAIKNAGANAVLVFSYIGLASQEVATAGKKVINVVLKDDQEKLKEVVVIGYGSVKKKDATGAVDLLSSKKFDNIAAISPAELLRGKVSGVQVTSSNGEPGASSTIRIRGNGSLRSGNGPLIVVDGVPLAGGNVTSGGADFNLGTSSAKDPLSFVNQNDIESISILKDASSTAIYGARGANGVIMITTKKGKSKVPEFSYNSSVTTGTYSSKFDMLSSNEFRNTAAGKLNDKGSDYNWKDAILQDSFAFNNDFAFSSSTDKSNTRFSIGTYNSTGLVKKTGLDKYTASFYNSNEFLDSRLKVETRLSYANVKDQRALITNNTGYIGNLLSAALVWNPTKSPYDISQPSGYSFIADDYINPFHLLEGFKNNGDLSKLLANVNTTVKLTKNLNYNLLVAIETSNSTVGQQANPDLRIKDFATATNPEDQKVYFGQAQINNDKQVNKTVEHYLTYNKSFSDNFNLNALVGYSFYDYRFNGNSLTSKGFAPTQRNLLENINGGIPTETRGASYDGLSETQSFYVRTSLNLYKRLNLDLTLRRDGSSKAGIGLKYGNFPSAGIAYKLISEKPGFINDLKIRGNYGKTGNIEIGRNISTSAFYYNGPLQAITVNNGNSNITWEKTTSSGVGVDFTLLKNRVSGSVDYFTRDTKDLILGLASTSGQPSPVGIRYENIDANLNNKGFEFGLNVKVVDTKDFGWDVSGNMAFLKNKVTGLGDNKDINVGAIHGQGLSDAYIQKVKNDYPLYNFYMAEFAGYNSAGKSLYINKDGSVVDKNPDAKIIDAQPLPTTTMGFNTTFRYKNLDLGTSFYGSFGNYIFNNTNVALFYKNQLGGKNVTPNAAFSEQSDSDANTPSTKYLEKGDFIRMGNITLGYTFANSLLEKIKIKSLRIYGNGSNLLLFTDYSGFDPEVDTNKSLNGVTSAGIEYLSYPRQKSFTFGLNVTF